MIRRQFTGASVTEQPDGSAVLVVRTIQYRRPCEFEIHLAKHVCADIGFLFYQRYANEREIAARTRERGQREQERAGRLMGDAVFNAVYGQE
jgi:hypothetical protein